MAFRYVSRPRTRSGILLASMPSLSALGTGSASNPVFSGSLIASLASSFTATASGIFVPPDVGGGSTIVPTHYVEVDAGGSGIGTISNPFTLAQACALAQPNWDVQMGPGVYVGPNHNATFAASFSIPTLGTQSNKIRFFAKNYAALTSSGRTIIQNGATSDGQGCPVFALNTGQELLGIYVNEDQSRAHADSGVIVVSGQYAAVRYCRISRGVIPWTNANNHSAVRLEPAQFCEVTDNWLENYTGASVSEQAVMVFSNGNTGNSIAHSISIDHNMFDNNKCPATIKGAGTARPWGGNLRFRNNLCRAANTNQDQGGPFLMDTGSANGRNVVSQNIIMGGCYGVITYFQASGNITDVDIVNNTFVNITNNGDRSGMHADWFGASTTPASWRIHNNIKTGSAILDMYRYSADAALLSRSHNLSLGGSRWAESFNRSAATLAQWQALGFDAGSLLVDPHFVSSIWGSPDLAKLELDSPCRNAAIDILNLNGGGTSAACHMGAYSADDVVIGIRPLT